MSPHEFRLGPLRCSTHTVFQLLEEVRALLADKTLQPRTILCVNAHIYNLAWSDAELRQVLNEARIVAADGMGIVAAARLLGEMSGERCNMTEAFRAFLQADRMAENTGVLVGLTEEEGRIAASAIGRMSSHCSIVRAIPGHLDDADYERLFTAYASADFIFVGMGTPRTERLSRLARAICPEAVVWGIGGGTIKIFAGTMREAPALFPQDDFRTQIQLRNEPEHAGQSSERVNGAS